MMLTDVELTDALARKYPQARFTKPPMIAGTVIPEYVRCGKSGCKCAGGELHGPYFYHTAWKGKRLRRTYVPKSELFAVVSMCQNRQAQQAMACDNRRQWETVLRNSRAMIRDLKGRR